MGVHFRNVGVHWVLYPHATSHPAAPALRMPAAAPMPPLASPTQGNSASSGTHATTQPHTDTSPPMGLQHNTTPLGHTPQQSASAARITRTAQSQGEPTPEGQVSTVHRPPFQNAMHSRTDGARITLKPKLPGEPSGLHFAPNTSQPPPQAPVPNPSGYDHFYRGHRGQTVTTPLTHCHH